MYSPGQGHPHGMRGLRSAAQLRDAVHSVKAQSGQACVHGPDLRRTRAILGPNKESSTCASKVPSEDRRLRERQGPLPDPPTRPA
jgi:hypothetical protein